MKNTNHERIETPDTWNRERSTEQLASFVMDRWKAAGLDESEL